LGRLVFELAVVHDSAHRWACFSSDLDEVEVETSRNLEGFGQRLDADLLSVGRDESYFPGSDLFIDPGVAFIWACYGLARLTKGTISLFVYCLGNAVSWKRWPRTENKRGGHRTHSVRPSEESPPSSRGLR
jgi:hypothetical protein